MTTSSIGDLVARILDANTSQGCDAQRCAAERSSASLYTKPWATYVTCRFALLKRGSVVDGGCHMAYQSCNHRKSSRARDGSGLSFKLPIFSIHEKFAVRSGHSSVFQRRSECPILQLVEKTTRKIHDLRLQRLRFSNRFTLHGDFNLSWPIFFEVGLSRGLHLYPRKGVQVSPSAR